MAQVDIAKLEAAVRLMLDAIGEDQSRPGLVDTPNRVARMWANFFLDMPEGVDRAFPEDFGNAGEEVVVRSLRFSSTCEHHLLPVLYDVDVRCRPDGNVLGLSKFARIGSFWAQRLQVQERFTLQYNQALRLALGTEDVRVDVRGVHTCMTWRGVFQGDVVVDTNAGSGIYAAPTSGVEADKRPLSLYSPAFPGSLPRGN